MHGEKRISKSSDFLKRYPPHLKDYSQFRAQFSWENAKSGLSGLPKGRGTNIAFEAVDRHVLNARGNHLAFRWLGRSGQTKEFSYKDLYELSNRFANVLAELGVKKGEAVFSLLGRVPELYFSALGTLKHRAVFCPLFSAFGPEPIKARLLRGNAKVLVTSASLYQKKLSSIRKELPNVEHVLIVPDVEGKPIPGTLDFCQLLNRASAEYEIQPTNEEDPALLHFTSGTTGFPKGAIHVHKAVLAHYWTGRIALDFHDDAIFWCTADPGWVTGTSYGIISPLANGISSIIDEADFDADRWYRILAEQKVSVWVCGCDRGKY